MLPLKQIFKPLLFIMFCTFLFVSSGYAESDSLTGKSDTLVVKGLVKKIDFETKTVVIKPKKGKRMRFIYRDQTKFKGFLSLEEIKKRQQIKIWYFKDGEKNRALKIQLIPELGC